MILVVLGLWWPATTTRPAGAWPPASPGFAVAMAVAVLSLVGLRDYCGSGQRSTDLLHARYRQGR